VRRGPPSIGEHSGEVLRQFGLDATEIDALLANAVVVQKKETKQ